MTVAGEYQDLWRSGIQMGYRKEREKMGREIRRVPQGWEHPKDEEGHYRPLFDRTYLERIRGHLGELAWYIKHPRHLREWFEAWPDHEYCRPHWRKGEATHYQVYEDVTEGTPVSPVFASLDEMETWLVGEGFSERASQKFIIAGWAPSFVITPSGVSGIGIHSLDAFPPRESS